MKVHRLSGLCGLCGLCVVLVAASTFVACATTFEVELPHQNIDATTLTNLASIVVYIGDDDTMANAVKKSTFAASSSPVAGEIMEFEYTPDRMGYIAVKARNTDGWESAFSPVIKIEIPNIPILFRIKL